MSEKLINEAADLHGGNIYKASKQYGICKEDFLDYSANINPLGVPDEFKETILSNIELLSNYPDPECHLLRRDISEYLDINPDEVIIGNGAAEIIFLLLEELKPKKVIIPSPTFMEYERAAKKVGAEVNHHEIKESAGFRLEVNELINRIDDDTDCIILCNPNNPTSSLTNPDDLIKLIGFAYRKEITVIIDETFIELTVGGNTNSMVKHLNEWSNLIIIRAFTKLFAIPGLRVGYGLGNKELIKRLWDRKIPWSVNCFATISGMLLKNKTGYFDRTAAWISEEIERFYNKLCKVDKFHVFKPHTNFVLMKIKDSSFNSHTLKEAMASKGVLIREASNFRFLSDRFIRVAIKDMASNDRFMKILEDVLK